jgi:hypothetical protein
MAECDQRLRHYRQQQQDRSRVVSLPQEKRRERLRQKKKGNTPQFDLREELFRMTGNDLTEIDGIDVTTTMTMLGEAGWDISKWKTEFPIILPSLIRLSGQHHFVSWLRLCTEDGS